MSDLHTEHDTGGPAFVPPRLDVDVVVLAGDIGKGVGGVKWAAKAFPDTPVVYVLGNHEYYGGTYPLVIDKMKTAAVGSSVNVLENDTWTHPDPALSSWRFLGCTLWTDFALTGNDEVNMIAAQMGMDDYTSIRVAPHFKRLKALHTRAAHKQSRGWLVEQFEAGGTNATTIVVTHHLPSARSLNPRFAGSTLNPAYASNLDGLIAHYHPPLWIHGHTHSTADYRDDRGTRVVCNPRGYPRQKTGFDAGMIVTVGSEEMKR